MNPAALANELLDLVDAPLEMRGPGETERYDQVRLAVGQLRGADRTEFYAAAVAAIDPHHALGPYPGFDSDSWSDLTFELYTFETKRLARLYCSVGPDSDGARRLLVVTDPLLHSYSPQERHGSALLTTMLACGELTADDFPDFKLREYLRRRGADLAAWDAGAQRWAELEEAAATGTLDLIAGADEWSSDGPDQS